MAALLLAAPAPAMAQEGPLPPRIVVLGTSTVRTPPDTASLSFHIRGEGATSDAAVRALASRREAIESGIASLMGGAPLRTTNLSVVEARDKECQNEWQARGRLSEGECTVRGYIANMDATLKFSPVDKAGTATGLIARLGGSEVQLSGFTLSDDADARRRATAAALADARAQAEAIAKGAGVRLGSLYYVGDAQPHFSGEEIVVSAVRAPAPPPPPPPVPVKLTPQPVETQVRLTVTYTIAP
jgi:uncharacterized protein YggE